MGSETIRDVTIQVRLKLLDDKALKGGADNLRAGIERSTAEAGKLTAQATRHHDVMMKSAALEKEKLHFLDQQSRKILDQLKTHREITNEIAKQAAAAGAAARAGGAGAPSVPDESGAGIFGNFRLRGGKGAAGKLLGAAGFAMKSRDLMKMFLDEATQTMEGYGSEFKPDAMKKETLARSAGLTINAFDRYFRGLPREQRRYQTELHGLDPKLRVIDQQQVGINVQQDIQRKSQEYVSVLQRQIDSTSTLIDAQFKLKDVDMDLLRQRDKGISGATGIEKEIARKASARIGVMGVEGLTKEQLEIVKGNPILAPEYEQYRNRKYQAGLSPEDRELAGLTSRAFGNQAAERAAVQAAAQNIGVDQKIAVTMSFDQMDKMVREFKDKMLPEVIKLNQAMMAEVRLELDRRQTRQKTGMDGGF